MSDTVGRLARWQPYRLALAGTALLVVGALYGFSHFAQFVEGRPGVVLNDPLLSALPSIDLTWPIFAVIYGSLLAALIVLPLHPRQLIVGLLSYAVMVGIRMLAMWSVPLDPPADMIVLIDPVAGVGPGGALTRDLFFSGHVATLVVIALVLPSGALKRTIVTLIPILAIMLLLQHVHYTVDILCAPLFAYGSFRLANRMFAQLEPTFGTIRPE